MPVRRPEMADPWTAREGAEMGEDLQSGLEAVRLLDGYRSGPADRPSLHLCATERRAEEISRFLRAAAPDLAIVAMPPWDCLPYDWASPTALAMGRRMAALRRLGERSVDILLCSPAALLQRVRPTDAVETLAFAEGDAFDPDAAAGWAAARGYRQDGRVDEPGEIALRGAVLDVWPPDAPGPLRIEMEDGRIAGIRAYDPVTQLSSDPTDRAALLPASEMPPRTADVDAPEDPQGAEHWLPDAVEDLSPLPDVLPGARLTSTAPALEAAERFLAGLPAAQEERLAAELDGEEARRALPPDRLYLSRDKWDDLREGAEVLDSTAADPPPPVAAARRPRASLRRAVGSARRTVLLAGTERDRERMVRMLPNGAESAADWAEAVAVAEGGAATLIAPLDRGFRTAELLVLTARDVLGGRASATGDATTVPPWLAEAQELHEGDLVVHEDEGLARLDGVEPIEGGEALRLAYADGRTLLVPSAEAGLVWRYGHDEGEVAPDRLGGGAWAKRKARLARELGSAADRIRRAARARAETEAPVLRPAAAAYATVEHGFGWEETPDQRAAIRAVLDDLASGRPMDRLLVGDVGFGKTEVALRAAAAAAQSGRQVAVVAPTTVLARQHAQLFARRLRPAGIVVEELSRLRTPAEAKRVRAGLADGSVGVAVGTHALLGDAVRWEALGLVVVDEEQRFGTAHKRRLRTLDRSVHRLSMSATPIPRSLQGAISGLQDLSLIATAPARRRPVRTTVAAMGDGVIRDALRRERRRGGQSFVVVPRVADIAPTEALLKRLAPELSVRVAHGDLPPREIDEAMTGFAAGKGDVLLATAIVESGLDVPRANAMVVLRPQLFGLAQLHQLRGRVGRGSRQAQCWLLTDEEELPDATRRRLDTLAAADALGAGLSLSMADLDRRGAGALFGDAQTGHKSRAGAALTAEMLAAALREFDGDPVPAAPAIRIDAEAALPEDYIPRARLRATLYARIARLGDPEEADRLADEVEDRFGAPPPEARALLRLGAIRARAAKLGATTVTSGPKGVAIDLEGAEEWEDVPEGVERKDGRLVRAGALTDSDARIDAALDLLEDLA
jgi:transcription-repair coupling factor (superfamily II helicase)